MKTILRNVAAGVNKHFDATVVEKPPVRLRYRLGRAIIFFATTSIFLNQSNCCQACSSNHSFQNRRRSDGTKCPIGLIHEGSRRRVYFDDGETGCCEPCTALTREEVCTSGCAWTDDGCIWPTAFPTPFPTSEPTPFEEPTTAPSPEPTLAPTTMSPAPTSMSPEPTTMSPEPTAMSPEPTTISLVGEENQDREVSVEEGMRRRRTRRRRAQEEVEEDSDNGTIGLIVIVIAGVAFLACVACLSRMYCRWFNTPRDSDDVVPIKGDVKPGVYGVDAPPVCPEHGDGKPDRNCPACRAYLASLIEEDIINEGSPSVSKVSSPQKASSPPRLSSPPSPPRVSSPPSVSRVSSAAVSPGISPSGKSVMNAADCVQGAFASGQGGGQKFEDTRYEFLYKQTPAPADAMIGLTVINKLIEAIGDYHRIPEDDVNACKEAVFTDIVEKRLDTIALLGAYVWTAAHTLSDGTRDRELCNYINEAVRKDTSPLVDCVIPVCRMINSLILSSRRNSLKIGPQKWPESNETYRGIGMPAIHRGFFEEGKSYRAPMFLATSFSREKAMEFMFRNAIGENLATLFIIKFDAELKCHHANYLDGGDKEFTLPPYSGFKVLTTRLEEPGSNIIFVIEIAAYYDSMVPELKDVPLAPWH